MLFQIFPGAFVLDVLGPERKSAALQRFDLVDAAARFGQKVAVLAGRRAQPQIAVGVCFGVTREKFPVRQTQMSGDPLAIACCKVNFTRLRTAVGAAWLALKAEIEASDLDEFRH